ncbi:MAG: Ig-like domain-containing protein, partial [Bacteroidota bacterium]
LVVAGNAYLTNAATFYFVPNANFNGNTGFSYTVTDDLGLTDATPANATIVVAAVNDAPVVNDDSFAVTEDTVLTGNVLNNDTDADGDALSVTQFTVDTDGDTIPEVFAAGTIATIAGVGTIVVNVNGGFIFTPAINYNGSVPEVGYTLSDGTLTNTGTLNLGPITPVNDVPNAIADIVSMPVDTPVTLTPLSNDTDAEGDSLTLATIGGVAVTPGAPQSIPVSNGIINITAVGVISFTPNSGFSGVSVIPYTISDGADTDAANITINVSANVSPQGADTTRTIIEDGSYTFLSADFGFTDSDIDQTLNAVRIDSLPISGALFLNGLAITTTGRTITVADINAGNLTFVPAANANGSPYSNFTFSVQDSLGAFDPVPNTFTLNVTPVNDNPTATADSFTVAEDSGASVLNVLGNDSFAPDSGETLTVTSVTQPANGTVSLVGGVVSFTPNSNFFGSTSFDYTISDGNGGTATASASVTVTPVNDNPTATADSFTVA